MAIGGGTNAVVHLLALAGRVGVPLTLERFHELSRRTPLLANVRPSGEYLVEELHRAGGIRAVMHELAPLLHGDALTVTGATLADGFAGAEVLDRDVIAALDSPLAAEGGIAVVRGSLAPDGALIKRSAASPELLRHRGAGRRLRGRLRRGRSDRRPRARRRAGLGARPAQLRAQGRAGHAGVGAAADPEEAPAARRSPTSSASPTRA